MFVSHLIRITPLSLALAVHRALSLVVPRTIYLVTKLTLFLSLVSFFAAHQTATAAEWATYKNDSYQFKVDYPADIFAERIEAENGNGLTAITNDGAAEFRAYGILNTNNLTLKQVRDALLEDGDQRDFTYKRMKSNWLVLSGYEEIDGRQMIFYQRLAASQDGKQLAAFELIFPKANRKAFEPYIKRMSRSLTAPGK